MLRAAPVQETIRLLEKYYPSAHCALNFTNPLELLIATILSAQCTDERVNQVTPKLFARYKSAQDYAEANLSEIEEQIRSTGFYKNKAKSIKECCQRLVQEHGGGVPQRLEDLVQLKGVGRKTANVVLGNAFGIPSGVVVDTHVTRLSHRLGLSRAKTAEKIEEDLLKIIPQEKWILFSHLLIFHGRQVCKARKPRCEVCFLFELCPRKGV